MGTGSVFFIALADHTHKQEVVSTPTLHPKPYTLHPTPYTLHPTPYTLHPTPYTLHPPSRTRRVTGGCVTRLLPADSTILPSTLRSLSPRVQIVHCSASCWCDRLLGLGLRTHPGVDLKANRKSISHRCHLFEVAFVWDLTKETICLPLGCLQGGWCMPPPLKHNRWRFTV